MIVKSSELSKNLNKNFYLFHGKNIGHKESLVNELFKQNFKDNIYSYYEKDILSNLENFYNLIFSGSFFEEKKLIIIKESTDKICQEIENLIKREIDSVTIIFFSDILEKKSKLRNLFEKNKKLISIAFYSDNNNTLMSLAYNYFKKLNIPISSEDLNYIITKCNGERKFLLNELEKIQIFSKNKKKISKNEITQLINISENNNISELIDNCLAKNKKKIIYIINENNFNSDDMIKIIRTFLFKAKKLLLLADDYSQNKNLEKTIATAKPPIFWKDKELIKKQIKFWSVNQIKELIIEINQIELIIKKNTGDSIFIVTDFIFAKSKIFNN